MADRSNQSLAAYKDGKLVAQGDTGTCQVAITGLAPDTKVAAGDYQVAFTDGTNTSDKVDVPAFNVPDATVAVTGVTLSQKTVSMTVGDTKQVTATVTPDNAANKKVTFASDNETIATVADDGTITAIAAGSANITATTDDSGFTATCAVTVAA